MGRHINRSFILFLIRKFNINRQNHSKFCKSYDCSCLKNLQKELERWDFYTLNQSHNKWLIIFHQKNDYKITLFPVFISKNKQQYE